MFLSVVIPAYNESKNIQVVIPELVKTIQNTIGIEKFEIIIVDDHSDDNTYACVKELSLENIRGLRLSKRSGSHIAIRTGIKESRGDCVLCISADGQDDPSILSEMVQKLKDGSNIVWGVRKSRNEPFLQKNLAKGFYNLLKLFVGQKESNINLANADFYLLDRKIIDAVNSCNERNTSLFGLLVWLGFNQTEVEYERKERRYGKSKWNFSSRLKLAIDWIVSFSAIPLKLILFLGIIVSLIGFIYALVILVLALLKKTVPGFAENIIIMLFLGGIQLMMIGVIGEYLWRTLDETRNRPISFIEKDSITKEEM